MTIYYHAKTAGFYDSRAHGERTYWIADPRWKRPVLSIPDPYWSPSPDQPDAIAPLILVEDSQANAPLIEVANPQCLLPDADELVELSHEEYVALFAAQAEGKIITFSQGMPVAVDPPAPTWEQQSARYTEAVQAYMDQSAKANGYEDLKTAVSYADEPAVRKFQMDGAAYRTWRSFVWAFVYEQLANIVAGKRAAPTIQELIVELPPLVLTDA